MRAVPLAVGIGLIVLLGLINALPVNTVFYDAAVPTAWQIVILFAGAALIAWGIAGSPAFWRRIRIDPGELALVLALLVIALLLRLIGLETTLRLLPDESNFVSSANTILNDHDLLLLFPMSDVSPFPWLFASMQAETVAVFGRNLTGLRATVSIYGALTVVALYLLTRHLFDRRTALVAAIILLTLPPHLHFSRMIASMTTADAFMTTLHLAALVYAVKSRGRLAWGLAGVTLGLTQYYSDASKLLTIPFTVVYLGWLMINDPVSRAAIRVGIVRMVLAAAIIALPVYTTLIVHNRALFGRVQGNSAASFWNERFQEGLTIFELQEMGERLATPFLFLFAQPEAEAIYYGGTEPLVLRVLAPLLLIGTIAALTHWRRPGMLPLALVVAITLGNALFIRDSASSPRYATAFPMLALLLGLGVAAVYAGLARLRAAPRVLTAALLIGISLAQVGYYFGAHLDHFKLYHRRGLTYADPWDATLRVNALLPRTTQGIYIGRPAAPGQESSLLLGFLQNGNLYPFLGYEVGEITPTLLRTFTRDHGYAFLIETHFTETIALLYRFFPDAESLRYPKENIEPREQYALVYVPPLR